MDCDLSNFLKSLKTDTGVVEFYQSLIDKTKAVPQGGALGRNALAFGA